jgi:hypothetical protein
MDTGVTLTSKELKRLKGLSGVDAHAMPAQEGADMLACTVPQAHVSCLCAMCAARCVPIAFKGQRPWPMAIEASPRPGASHRPSETRCWPWRLVAERWLKVCCIPPTKEPSTPATPIKAVWRISRPV